MTTPKTLAAGVAGNNNAISFGTRVFSTGPASTRIANTSRLFKSNVLPSGLLLKEVNDLGDCVSNGGILLVHAASKRWILYVGAQLIDVIKHKLLGKVATHFALNALCEITAVDSGARTATYRLNNYVSTSTIPGGVIRRPVILKDYFNAGASLEAYAVVTGASMGMGTSHNTNLVVASTEPTFVSGVGRTVLQTMIPSNVEFGVMLDRTFVPHMLEAAPGSVRGYYESTARAAIAMNSPTVHPTLGVVETWNNLGSSVGYLWQQKKHVGGLSSADASALGLFISPSSALGAQSELKETTLLPAYSHNQAGDQLTNVATDPTFHIESRLGEIVGGLPVLMDDYVDAVAPYELPSGTVSGVNMTVLRDAMRLADSLGGGTVTNPIANYSDVGAYLAAAFAQTGIVRTNEAEKIQTAGEDAAKAKLIANSGMADQVQNLDRSSNLFVPGTLALRLERFSRSWDDLAFKVASA